MDDVHVMDVTNVFGVPRAERGGYVKCSCGWSFECPETDLDAAVVGHRREVGTPQMDLSHGERKFILQQIALSYLRGHDD